MNLGYWKSHEMMGGNRITRINKLRYFLVLGNGVLWNCFSCTSVSFYYRNNSELFGFWHTGADPSFGNMFKSHFDLMLRGDFYSIFIIVCFMIVTLGSQKYCISLITASPYISRTDPRKTH